jgi:CheY-like chemotaxis protein
MDINSDQFITLLRSALHHLYEPDQLRRSPLAPLLGIAERVDASSALQKVLLQAIEDLRPGDEEAQQSQSWMNYEVLFYRYVRGYAREAVANQLGISDRQLSREQRTAIETMAQHLWKAYQLEGAHGPLPGADLTAAQQSTSAAQPASAAQPGNDRPAYTGQSTAAAWIEALPTEKPSPWKPVLLSVMDLLGPLIHENDVAVQYDVDSSLPDLLVPQVVLRHSLLNLLGWMIPLARQGELILTPSLAEQAILITIQIPGRTLPGGAPDPAASMARQLIERVNGRLDLFTSSLPAEIRLSIPALAQITVLVIDDNADTIQLFQRYVQGSRYSIVGLQEPAEALRLVEKINPRIILMDVMMPEFDGWDLLTQMRQSHLAPNAAIVICSILPQEGLARSLGADGFLQKPVLPQDFLNALDHQMEHFHKEPDS